MNRVFYLDTNAWIRLLRPEGNFEESIRAHSEGKIHFCFSQENQNELIQNENISTENKDRDLPRLAALIDQSRADEIAILDHGKIGRIKFSSEIDTKIFEDHLSRAKRKDKNTIADGVHLLNAKNCLAVLVTRDDELIKSARRWHIATLELEEFLRIPELAEEP